MLRVQVVGGDVPFLIPAFFLTDLGAVIDMKSCKIMYMALGIKQDMIRLPSGHVAVSIVEFGRGFHVPADFVCTRSQIWSTGSPPEYGEEFHADGQIRAMGPVAALVAASLLLCFPTGVARPAGGEPWTTTSEARRLALRREQLERQALQLQQEEQKIISQATAQSSST